jgi:hypothetical protein
MMPTGPRGASPLVVSFLKTKRRVASCRVVPENASFNGGYVRLVESKLGEEAPVLESDQVKYIWPMPISLVCEAVSSCCILLQNFAQGEGREKVGYASPAPQIFYIGRSFHKGVLHAIIFRVRISRYSAAYTSHESVLCTQLMSMMPVSSHNASLVESVVGQQDGL